MLILNYQFLKKFSLHVYEAEQSYSIKKTTFYLSKKKNDKKRKLFKTKVSLGIEKKKKSQRCCFIVR